MNNIIYIDLKKIIDKMERFSGKIEIINHFDELMNRIDIDIDSSLDKFNNQQLLSQILKTSSEKKNFRKSYIFIVDFFKTFDSSKPNLNPWSSSTKIVDYLKQVRMRTIEELKTAQEEALENYKLISAQFKGHQINEKNIEQLRSELFAEKFVFQVHLNQSDNRIWVFNVFTFVTDFYMSPSDIESLE
jgi:hypothetical protein